MARISVSGSEALARLIECKHPGQHGSAAAGPALRVGVLGKPDGPEDYDLLFNAQTFTPEQMLALVVEALRAKGWLESPAERVGIAARKFSHPTEELFANLLDFYSIGWEYEPRSFPLQWDQDGKVLEAFTPDFYLPEFDLFVELTTMKQTLVRRKNRKIRLLRSIYPHINIQVFYQKDLQDLIMKYGIAGKTGA